MLSIEEFAKTLHNFAKLIKLKTDIQILNMPLTQILKILKFQNLKPSPKNLKMFLYFVHIEKITLTTENRSAVLQNLLFLDMSVFNELITENDPVKKVTSFFAFMEEVQLHYDQVLVL